MLVSLIQYAVEQNGIFSRGHSPVASEGHAEDAHFVAHPEHVVSPEGEIAGAASPIASPIEGQFLHASHASPANPPRTAQ